MKIKGQNVFITGSTRGIGLAMAKAFAKKGANIVLNGRKPVANDLIQEIESYGVKCVAISGDIADFNQAGEMLNLAKEQLGPISILINNAGITNDKLLLRMSASDFEEVIKINLTGAFNMTQQVLKSMLKAKTGKIINISSVSGLMGNAGQANYAASKAGLVGFTKSVAREVAPRGITCNAIAPGFIQTDMTEILSDKLKEEVTKSIPLQRFGQADEVANAAIFLAENDYLTGQVINVDGGLVMHG